MKALVIVLAALLLGACTTHTEYGACIGVGEDKKPDLEYKLSAWNTFLAIFFVELVAPPIFVLADETFCPVGKK